jgi:hypothetical protein
MRPSIGRVLVEVGRDRVLVVEDVTLPRGDWQSGGLDVFVAFGAPGAPVAFDARLGPAGLDDSSSHDGWEGLGAAPAPSCDGSVEPLVGPPQMAGVVVRIKEAPLRRVFAGADVATLRLRSVVRGPAQAPDGARDVVVRLGAADGVPLTLSGVAIRSLDGRARVIRAEASLCGPEADPWPLSIEEAPGANSASTKAIPPELAVRHASDNLCVRWWQDR